MVLTPSLMAQLGRQAPDFRLTDVVSGKGVTRDSAAGPKGLLVMFLCRHCPFVKHVERELAKIGRDYARSGIGIVAISSNDAAASPEDAPASLKQQAAELDFYFPYLYDETQQVARDYQARCTPDFFLHDASLRLVYRGQLDDSRPKSDAPIDGHDLRRALDALAAGHALPETEQKPSIGCNIKWKPGNEPAA
jgi:peroxiredoxin